MSALDETLITADDVSRECESCDTAVLARRVEAEVRARVVADVRSRLASVWGHIAPGCVDPEGVLDVLDDVEAGRPPAPVVDPSPDCTARKHAACDGVGWDFAADAPADCPCPCHHRKRGAR